MNSNPKTVDENSLKNKKGNLIRYLQGLDKLLVAFSGGVDSTFLLAVAEEVLGEKVVAATAKSRTFPDSELEEAIRFTKERGICHVVFPSEEMMLQEFLSNPPDRCYYCKKSLANKLWEIAEEYGIGHVAHAANLDDLKDYRPGMKAAEEGRFIAPLVQAKMNKLDVRHLSRLMGLSTWDKPSMACLASRIPYGDRITSEKLDMVDKAESFLRENGILHCRVRHHGTIAKIEVDSSMIGRIMHPSCRESIVKAFRQIGFLHIALDLEGYQSGRLNRALEDRSVGGTE